MANMFKMPRLGLTMTEGTIVKWLKEEGDFVKKGEEIVEIESDKSVSPVESTEEGHLLKILVCAGETVDCLTDIAVLGDAAETPGVDQAPISDSVAGAPGAVQTPAPDVDKEGVSGDTAETPGVDQAPISDSVAGAPGAVQTPAPDVDKEGVSGDTAETPGVDQTPVSDSVAGAPGAVQTPAPDVAVKTPAPADEDVRSNEKDPACKIFATPSAKRTAKELGIDLSQVPLPPGKSRIEKKDVLGQIECISSEREKTRGDRIVKLDGMRKTIASRMKESLDISAHVTLTTEVDMSAALDFRKQVSTAISERYGTEPSLNDLVVKCTAHVLRDFPRLNSVFADEGIIEKDEINIGIAVALNEGLTVPVIRRCDQKTLGEIAAESKRLSAKAKMQGLLADEMSGGTFTVSNLGMFGITQFTSIINQPESAILSVGAIVRRPFALDGDAVSVRPMMNLTINFDHRPIDGALSARFLQTLKRLLEYPALLLAE